MSVGLEGIVEVSSDFWGKESIPGQSLGCLESDGSVIAFLGEQYFWGHDTIGLSYGAP